ncbi:hypothetical protein NPX13_g8733 [Xylaria arbuscula]|uniref:Uncharacterized protein n=1 Tax=Xylaria arbuscula TaxID=114810 RepID=A0A9W8TJV8_9PEZI|nr:hypothetical protein NPX13_g8733 [Xylaria arbuscula]
MLASAVHSLNGGLSCNTKCSGYKLVTAPWFIGPRQRARGVDKSCDMAQQLVAVDMTKEVYGAWPGPGDGEANTSENQLSRSSVQRTINTPEEFVQSYQEEVDRVRDDAKALPAQLITALLRLGAKLANHPDLGDAEAPLREARERILDSDDSTSYIFESLVFTRVLGSVLQNRGHFDKADELYVSALEITRHSHGREHPWTLELQSNLGCLRIAAGSWYKTQGHVDKARECFDSASILLNNSLRAKMLIFGESHRATLKTKCNIELVSFLLGDLTELETGFSAAMHTMEKLYGPDDSDLKRIAGQLTTIKQQRERHDDASENPENPNVDQKEYDIRPFEDTLIPELPTLERCNDHVDDVEVEQKRTSIGALHTAFDWLYPDWVTPTVRALAWSGDFIKDWTGMDMQTVVEALGFPKWQIFAEWSIVTRREVLLEQAAAGGHCSAVGVLLQSLQGAEQEKLQDKEAILNQAFHRAIESGSIPVVRLFLASGRNPTVVDNAGTPALHKAAQLGLEKVLMELVKNIDDIDVRDGNGDTPLDIALRENHESVIRFLMRRKGALIASMKPATKDSNVESTRKGYDLKVFDKILYTGMNATVVNFHVDLMRNVEEHRVWSGAVEGVASDRNILERLVNDKERTGETPDSTWIHIPTNNMFWVEVIMTSISLKFPVTTALMKNLTTTNDDRERYMNLLCDEVWSNQLHESLHDSVREYPNLYILPSCHLFNVTDVLARLAAHESDTVVYMPYIHWESEFGKAEMDKVVGEAKHMSRNRLTQVRDFISDQVGRWIASADNASTALHKEEEWIYEETSPDSRLLYTYLYTSGMPPLHVRRTFDQFQYYMNDNTAARDSDQVISRYFHRRFGDLPVPIMMVDQLWMWIIGEGTIITCFPQKWGDDDTSDDIAHILDTTNILDSVLERLNVKLREPIMSVYELTDVILARCLGLPFDSTQWANEQQRYLEIFAHSINYVADEEIRLFNYFADRGKSGEKFKQRRYKEATLDPNDQITRRKLRTKLAQKTLEHFPNYKEARAIMSKAKTSKRHWGIEEKDMEEIFDISNEIELLKEIKDIQDELNILRTLFSQQIRVLESYHHASGKRSRSSEAVSVLHRFLDTVKKLDIDAQRPYKARPELLVA